MPKQWRWWFRAGRRAKGVSEAEALSHVFGYATGNDFTARDLQSRSSQWMIGKRFDGSGLIGPTIVSADQVDSTRWARMR